MTIKEVIDKAIAQGCLNPALATALLLALEDSYPQGDEDVAALARLEEAVKDGRIVTLERKRCFNVMEEMVWDVLEREYATLRLRGIKLPEIGDVAAHALNHIKPLYAGSKANLDRLRENAKAEYAQLVRKRIREAMDATVGHTVAGGGGQSG